MSEPSAAPRPNRPTLYGSDAIVHMLRRLGVPLLAINPGASFRGLHDSIVNHLGNRDPRLVLTLHEAQAVAMAHGYAKVTGEPLGVVLHANVGLMNAVMAIFDAYVDRVPMLVIGATGHVDAARRRPWIEWIHTSRDQGALVRNFTKWDDQPASIPAALESLMRAWRMTAATPPAPVYVCLDVALQEDALPADLEALDDLLPDVEAFPAPREPVPAAVDFAAVAERLAAAERPLVMLGRHRRTGAAWDARIALADATGAAVLCDQKSGVGFPGDHPGFVGAPAQYPDAEARAALDAADLVLSLDWPDLAGTLSLRTGGAGGLATIVVSPDEALHNGWSFDHFGLPAACLRLPVHPDVFVAGLLPHLGDTAREPWHRREAATAAPEADPDGPVTHTALATTFERVRGSHPVCLTRLPFGWPDRLTRFTGPLDCIGYDGGGGIGSTPGITVGAALALKGTGRLPVAILGDGDLLMGAQALWTAAAESLPALFIVSNNRAFFNDVEHQERVARHRDRDVANREIGMMIDGPPVDIAGLARSCGLEAFGPVARAGDLEPVLRAAFDAALAGRTVLVDVIVPPPAP